MDHHASTEPDFGTGQKKLGIYLIGLLICTILTIISFWTVIAHSLTPTQMFTIIYASAVIQFFVQLICFLRLNTETEQGRMNVMSILFTFVILASIIIGSLWIMWNLNYNMMH